MRKMLRNAARTAVATSLLFMSVAHADDYGDARAAMVAAYQASEFESMEAAAHRALEARPGYPGALFNLALAQVLNNRAYASLETLDRLAELGILSVSRY